MSGYMRMIQKAAPPLEDGEVVLDARRCMPKGSTLVRGLAVGGAVGAADAGVALGTVKKAGNVVVKGVGAYKHQITPASGVAAETEASRFPSGGLVIAVTNRRFLLFAHQEGAWKGKISYLQSKPLSWISKVQVHTRFSAPRVDFTFPDGSVAMRELPRDSWGMTAGKFVQSIRAAQASVVA